MILTGSQLNICIHGSSVTRVIVPFAPPYFLFPPFEYVMLAFTGTGLLCSMSYITWLLVALYGLVSKLKNFPAQLLIVFLTFGTSVSRWVRSYQ